MVRASEGDDENPLPGFLVEHGQATATTVEPSHHLFQLELVVADEVAIL